MRTAIVFLITYSVVAIMYRRFGTTRRTDPQGSITFDNASIKRVNSLVFDILN